MMGNSISRTNKFIRDIFSEYKDLSNHEKGNLNNLSNNVSKQNNESIYTSAPSPDNEEYMNKEKEQEENKKINEKINDLEKHQNRMTEFKDKYKYKIIFRWSNI